MGPVHRPQPPQATGKATPGRLTRFGFETLNAELRYLWDEERPRVVQGIADAAAEGDRSENAEYIYGKKRLRELDRRIRYLSFLLKDVKVVDIAEISDGRAGFGAEVEVEDDDGVRHTWTLVGDGEAGLREGFVSMKSPVARALVGKREADEVCIERPRGELWVVVQAVRQGKIAP